MKPLSLFALTVSCLLAGCDKSDRGDHKSGRSKRDNPWFQVAGAGKRVAETPGDVMTVPVSFGGQRRRAKVDAKDVLRLRPVKIEDRQGWSRPVTARVLLAPVNWKVEGGVQWRAKAFKGEEIQERFAVTRPDGLARFESVPTFRWGYSNSMRGNNDLRSYGTRVARVATALQAVRQFVLPTLRSQYRVKLVSIKRNDKASATMTKSMQAQFQKSPTLREHRVKADVVTAKVAYQVNGRDCEEVLLLCLISSRQPTVGIQMRQFARSVGMHAGPQGFIDQYSLAGFAFRVPQGEMKQHTPLLTTMMASTRQNPAWLQAVAQHRHKMQQMRLKGMWDRHQLRMRTHRQIAAMQQWGWEKRQATRDQQAARYSRSIREVELYHDPVLGRNIELGAGYKFVYRNGRGEYLLFNNPLFDPNVELDGEWQKLRQVR